jgi:predicted dehydrogenase
MERRKFLRESGLSFLGMGLMAAIPMDVLSAIRRQVSPNDRIGVGLIGCKGMGWNNLTSMLKMSEIACVALCDVDDAVLAQRKGELATLNLQPTIYKDYRKLLEDKKVDIVIIATPDHWHCLIMADACAAGKHILLEKPASNSVGEAEIMMAVAKKYKSIVQVNQWQRSQQHFKDAIAFVHSGKLGTIAQTKAWMFNGHKLLPKAENGPVPMGVDYQMWLGPASERPFNPNRFHYNFRWYWDYAGGLMTDWGVHLIDMVLLGMKPGLPQSVVSVGGHLAYPDDARQTPDTQTAVYQYEGFQMIWEHTMGRQYGHYGLNHGIAFIGSNGTLLLDRSGWEVRPEKDRNQPRMEGLALQKKSDDGVDMHTQNMVQAIKAGDAALLNCPIEAGATTAIHCHLGNIAYRSGKIEKPEMGDKIQLNDPDSHSLLLPKYHHGWKIPVK